MKTYWNIEKSLKAIPEWQPNCWIQVTCPTDEDQRELEEKFNIPDYFISDISDTDERARYEYDDGWMLIILRIPYVKEIRSRTPYTTVPLGIIHKRDVTITVCFYETNMMIDFVSYQQKRGEGFTDYVDMIFRLFLSSAVWYLKRLKQINALIEKAKHNLDHEVNNESLIGLSRLQDSLTYFITSIRGNENLLQKLKFKLQVDELDAELIEDVNIEMTQARETTSIYSDILESTMDTYSSIINNNMNTVMRTLTSVTIIMMSATFIASLYGMNVTNGLESNPWGFAITLVMSFAVSALCWVVLRYKRLLGALHGGKRQLASIRAMGRWVHLRTHRPIAINMNRHADSLSYPSSPHFVLSPVSLAFFFPQNISLKAWREIEKKLYLRRFIKSTIKPFP